MSHLTVDVFYRDADTKSKQQAEYTDSGTPQEHCAICRHYTPPDNCEIVTGRVVAGGWCKYFKRK